VLAHDAGGTAQFMVDQKSKLIAVAAKRAEAIGNADQTVAADAVADSENRGSSTPGTLGTRYGSVVVLGPKFFAAAALRGSNSVGPTRKRGAVTSAPFKKVLRPSVFVSAPVIGWA